MLVMDGLHLPPETKNTLQNLILPVAHICLPAMGVSIIFSAKYFEYLRYALGLIHARPYLLLKLPSYIANVELDVALKDVVNIHRLILKVSTICPL
jgi:hypothetical protein